MFNVLMNYESTFRHWNRLKEVKDIKGQADSLLIEIDIIILNYYKLLKLRWQKFPEG